MLLLQWVGRFGRQHHLDGFLKAGHAPGRSGGSITLFLSACFTRACYFKNNQVLTLDLENEIKLGVFPQAGSLPGEKSPLSPTESFCSGTASFLRMEKGCGSFMASHPLHPSSPKPDDTEDSQFYHARVLCGSLCGIPKSCLRFLSGTCIPASAEKSRSSCSCFANLNLPFKSKNALGTKDFH